MHVSVLHLCVCFIFSLQQVKFSQLTVCADMLDVLQLAKTNSLVQGPLEGQVLKVKKGHMEVDLQQLVN